MPEASEATSNAMGADEREVSIRYLLRLRMWMYHHMISFWLKAYMLT